MFRDGKANHDIQNCYYKNAKCQGCEVKGKVALITGSSSGIGLGIAQYLASKGCDVIKTGLASKEVIDRLADNFKRSYEGKSVFINSDLSKVDSTTDLFNEINKHYPNGIDIIVNNAGIQHVCTTDKYPIEKWHDMLAIHLTAPFLICRHFIPFMKDKGWGRIVNVSSMMGLVSSPGRVPYSTTKSGVIGMTRGLALELAETGVTCNVVCPGFVETELVAKTLSRVAKEQNRPFEEVKEEFFREIHPIKKPVTVQEVSSLVGHLCSEEASSITGSVFTIDGGYTAR